MRLAPPDLVAMRPGGDRGGGSCFPAREKWAERREGEEEKRGGELDVPSNVGSGSMPLWSQRKNRRKSYTRRNYYNRRKIKHVSGLRSSRSPVTQTLDDVEIMHRQQ